MFKIKFNSASKLTNLYTEAITRVDDTANTLKDAATFMIHDPIFVGGVILNPITQVEYVLDIHKTGCNCLFGDVKQLTESIRSFYKSENLLPDKRDNDLVASRVLNLLNTPPEYSYNPHGWAYKINVATEIKQLERKFGNLKELNKMMQNKGQVDGGVCKDAVVNSTKIVESIMPQILDIFLKYTDSVEPGANYIL